METTSDGVRTETVHGVRLVALKDRCVEDFRRHGQIAFEPESMAAWEQACRSGRGCDVVDVGAYSGIYSLVAAKHDCQVYAFEPNPEVYLRLLANIDVNDCSHAVVTSNHALTDSAGVGTQLLAIPNRPMTSGARLGGVESKMVPVFASRLDTMIPSDANVVAIKIDTEGHEAQVLNGAKKTISRCKPLVIAEVLDRSAHAYLETILRGFGYTDLTLADGRNLIARP